MSEQYHRNVIEAGLLAAGKSLTLAELAQLFDENARPPAAELRAALDALAADYAGRALELRETASGFRVQVRREFAAEVARLWPERPQRYSRALLETLALIAYRQPITRAEIESVRGVAVNPNIVKTLLERNWIRVVGHRDLPGRPELLGTTREFLDYFGLRTLEELPTLAQLRSLNDIDPQLSLPVAGAPAATESGEGGEAGDAMAGPDATLLEDLLVDGGDDAEASEDDGGDSAGGDSPLSATPGLVAAPPGADD
jgi:segregation and condensation protein B